MGLPQEFLADYKMSADATAPTADAAPGVGEVTPHAVEISSAASVESQERVPNTFGPNVAPPYGAGELARRLPWGAWQDAQSRDLAGLESQPQYPVKELNLVDNQGCVWEPGLSQVWHVIEGIIAAMGLGQVQLVLDLCIWRSRDWSSSVFWIP